MQRLLSPTPLPWAEQGPDDLPWVCLCVFNLYLWSAGLAASEGPVCSSASLAGISVCRQAEYMCACMRACVHMCVFGIGLHADELQPVFTPRVQAWWVVVGGVHLCEDARVGGEPLKAQCMEERHVLQSAQTTPGFSRSCCRLGAQGTEGRTGPG